MNSFKKLIKQEIKDNKIECTYESGKTLYIVEEQLNASNIAENAVIICLNTKNNLDFLINKWNLFLKKNLKIIFVNPKLDLKWAIFPIIHNKVIENDNLKPGLMSLFESIPKV